jgi:hypothetical protein
MPLEAIIPKRLLPGEARRGKFMCQRAGHATRIAAGKSDMRFPNHNTASIRCLPLLALLLSACNRGGLPSRLERIPGDLANPALQVTEIYPDGWIGETGSLMLQQPGGDQAITVRGMVPKIGEGAFATEVELKVDEKAVARQTVGTGDFRVSGRVPEGKGSRKITIAFASLQELPGGDGRQVGARLQFVGFEAPSAAPPAASARADILKGTGAQLGAGWGALETFQNETFRWVTNDAEIRLAAVSSPAVELSVVLEAGPGLGTTSFELRVLDGAAKQIGTARVRGRGTVKVVILMEAGKPCEVRLHVDGGGKPAPNDPRILNFRVFQLSVKPSEVR